MDRLTSHDYCPELEFCSHCQWYGEPNGCNREGAHCDEYPIFVEAYARLAAYEDTGLTPEEVAALCDEVKRLRAWTKKIAELPYCNDCADQKFCTVRPEWGDICAINCPLWRGPCVGNGGKE